MRRHQLLPVVALLATLTAGCSSLPDPFGWFETDNQAPPTPLAPLTPKLEVKTLWSRRAGSGGEEQYLKLVPAVYRGRVLVADSKGEVSSLKADTGEPVWSTDTKAPIAGGPGVGGGLALVGTREGQVIALKEEDGKQLWRAQLSSEVLSVPAASDSTVVAHTIDGKLYGLRADNGKQAWVYDRTSPVLTLRGSSSPVIYESSVVAGFAGGRLARLALGNGDPQWEVQVTEPHGRSELARIVDIDADPVISSDVVLVSTYQGDVAAVGLDSGVVLWRRQMSSYAGLAADWRRICVTDSQDRVWALDPHSGASLWKQEAFKYRHLTAPAILDDYVLVGDLEGYVHWLSYDDGSEVARVRVTDAPIAAAPRVVNGVAYVYADDGTVAALTPATPSPVPQP